MIFGETDNFEKKVAQCRKNSRNPLGKKKLFYLKISKKNMRDPFKIDSFLKIPQYRKTQRKDTSGLKMFFSKSEIIKEPKRDTFWEIEKFPKKFSVPKRIGKNDSLFLVKNYIKIWKRGTLRCNFCTVFIYFYRVDYSRGSRVK